MNKIANILDSSKNNAPKIVDDPLSKLGLVIPFTSNEDSINNISLLDKKGRLYIRDKIESFAIAMQTLLGSETGEMDEINEKGLEEHFVGGAYIRGLRIPKGEIIISKLWTKERFWIITEGEVSVTTELWTKRIKAPYTAIAPYGTRVALYAHEETMWYAITGGTDKDTIEDEIFTKDHSGIKYPWDQLGVD
jgi:NADPH-dependent 2,4-dienoyl-CoA reductase/sulfur reductase-like enzyme